ncbi:response regulator [Salimicrobium halophilum]|uniref:Two-component system, response regulator YcbB n=1 Tax=Salimicrobium halophilum TaxID=86666 RepID=A0A1G8WH90_9BACI|nr:response regulator [Salimicrobium halophilum]SDJ77561.1 two-component system, response regulator YcbB [Salimicrobium halophilum]
MNYFIVDDDISVRAMLTDIIEDEDLGSVVGEREDGGTIDASLLETNSVDVLLIDLLMRERDGIETVRQISGRYEGKVVMISQIEAKDLIGEAYSLGVEYYITKPLNRLEVLHILKKVNERIVLDQSIKSIQRSLSVVTDQSPVAEKPTKPKTIKEEGYDILAELGIAGENGSRDLLEMIDHLYKDDTLDGDDSISLKSVYQKLAFHRAGEEAKNSALQREVKAAEQRVRRAIHQAISHIASLGVDDFGNPVFDKYASAFFDYEQVRKKMMELEKGKGHRVRVDTKKFIQMLYWEAKRNIEK